MTSTVSVVIPVYNGLSRVASAVTRLMAQSVPPHEIVIVDDGSSDGSAALISSLAADNPTIVPVLLSENGGVLRAREAGVRASSGDAVWFVDDDDAWSPSAIAELTAALTDDVDAVIAAARFVAFDGAEAKRVSPPASDEPLSRSRALTLLLEGRITGHLWNKLFRRSTLMDMPFTPARVHSDLGMVAAALSRSRAVAVTQTVVYDYHPRAGSIIGSRTPRFDSLMAIDGAVSEALLHGAPELTGSDPHVYFRTRFIWLSALKDAEQAEHPAAARAAILRRGRAQLSPRAFRVLLRRRDAPRLALAVSAKASRRAHRAMLKRADGGSLRGPQETPTPSGAETPTASSASGSPVQVFCIGRGQFENIGDIILRRPLVDWARDAGVAHVYVGASPEGYDRGLGLQGDDIVYRSYRDWYRAALRAAWSGRAAYFFKPGETQLTVPGLKEHIAVLPLLLTLRLRRGRVVRVGSGARDFNPLPRALMQPSIALSDLVLWRDPRTASYLGGGGVMPDLAFSEGASDDVIAERRADPTRNLLIVSMRPDDDGGSRPYPSPDWISGVRTFAAAHGLTVCAVAQVQRDSERAERLARDLDGSVLAWHDGSEHDVQEARLREAYARSVVVVSDRLHVLIAAFTEGAVPFAALTVDSDKVDRHFRAIGVEGISVVTRELTAARMTASLETALGRADDLFAALRSARRELAGVRARVLALTAESGTRRRRTRPTVAPQTDRRPVVVHLGRAGEVAGGMTQVVNSYLKWDFPNVDVRLLKTRGNPGDQLAAAKAYLRAVRTIMRMPRHRPIVIVAHVSTGGSFVREGSLLLLAARRGFGTIAHIHGSTFAAFAARRPQLVGPVLRRASLVISLSEEITAVCATFVDPAKVVLVPNAVPDGAPDRKRDSVVFGGAVGHRKGVDVLLDAWRDVDAPGWELTVAGPLLEPALAEDPPAGVTFTGSMPHHELMGMLNESRIAVLPSRGEAMPMFVLEAMARDNCVIASDVGGVPEVLADGAGIVVPAGDVQSLTEALQTAITDAAARDAYAGAARDRFRSEFAAEAVFPRLEAVWLSVLPGAARRTAP